MLTPHLASPKEGLLLALHALRCGCEGHHFIAEPREPALGEASSSAEERAAGLRHLVPTLETLPTRRVRLKALQPPASSGPRWLGV